MTVPAIIQRHFDARLRELGFVPHASIPHVWVKPTGTRSELMVDVELGRIPRHVSIWLRRRASQEDVFDLAEAAGLRWYEYRNRADLDAVMAKARQHFEAWGVDWLEGRAVTSPALEAKAQLARQWTHARLVDEARQAFKVGSYDTAIAKFSEAAGLAPLDNVSDKMLGIACRKGNER